LNMFNLGVVPMNGKSKGGEGFSRGGERQRPCREKESYIDGERDHTLAVKWGGKESAPTRGDRRAKEGGGKSIRILVKVERTDRIGYYRK